MLAPMRGMTRSNAGTFAPPTWSDGLPRVTTIWTSSGPMTLPSWPRARAPRTRRLVEYRAAFRDRTRMRMREGAQGYLARLATEEQGAPARSLDIFRMRNVFVRWFRRTQSGQADSPNRERSRDMWQPFGEEHQAFRKTVRSFAEK